MKTDCAECGHPWAAHAHYRWGTECSLCDCTAYQPKPRRRWLPRNTRRPAGVEPNPPKQRLPLPGPNPAHPHDGQPPASAAGAPAPPRRIADWRVTEWDCSNGHSCVRVINHQQRRIIWTRCARHKRVDWDAVVTRILDEA